VLRHCYLCNNLFSFSAFPKDDPMIEGVLSTYSIGDYVTANCTSGKSNPLAVMSWKIDHVNVRIVDLCAVLCQPLVSSYCQPLVSSYCQPLVSSYCQPLVSSYCQPLVSSYCQPLVSSYCQNSLFWDRLIAGFVQCLKLSLQHLAVKTEFIWIIYDQLADKHAWN